MTQKTLLVVLAHPDDESFGPGGTLAHYAREGHAVHYVCGTRGESGTVDADKLHGFKDAGELRSGELACAARELGLTSVNFLGFRDSGMHGSDENEHADSLHQAPLDEVAKRIVAYIDEFKPDAILTHDQFGGYGHPDHIKLHQAMLRAYALRYGITIDVSHWNHDQKPVAVLVTGEAINGPAPKLYFTTFPKRTARMGVWLLPLLGRDPRKFGRNNDIDLVKIASWDLPVTAEVDTRSTIEIKKRASACHASQQSLGGGNLIFRLLIRRNIAKEFFSRVYPAVDPRAPHEHGLL